MATKSVTVCATTVPANNFMRVGGVLESGWAVAAPTYTVPAGKRLVVKTTTKCAQGSVAGRMRYVGSSTATNGEVFTHIFGAGQVIEFTVGDANVFLFGLLEDDV